MINTKLSDWFFRLGSTNAMVGEYQVNNLPCPVFADKLVSDDGDRVAAVEKAIASARFQEAFDHLQPFLNISPFSLVVQEAVIAAVRQIIQLEAERGEIARQDRSALDPAAQPYQDFIDRLFYGMAGLTDQEVRELEERYERML